MHIEAYSRKETLPYLGQNCPIKFRLRQQLSDLWPCNGDMQYVFSQRSMHMYICTYITQLVPCTARSEEYLQTWSTHRRDTQSPNIKQRTMLVDTVM